MVFSRQVRTVSSSKVCISPFKDRVLLGLGGCEDSTQEDWKPGVGAVDGEDERAVKGQHHWRLNMHGGTEASGQGGRLS